MTLVETPIAQIDDRLAELMQAYPLILSVPGMGPTWGAAILGEIGNIHRFASGKKLKAYAGLDASVHQSREFHGTRTHLSKRGSPSLRRALWLAAHLARRFDPTFQAYYDAKRAQGKHPNQALGAVVGKLCHVLWAVLTHETPYDPTHLRPSSLPTGT